MRAWPIIAAGRVAFEVVSLLVADSRVIGIPHPTGTKNGAFGRVFRRIGERLVLRAGPKRRVGSMAAHGAVYLSA